MRNDENLGHSFLGLFGTSTRSLTLLLVGMLGETHAGEVARILERSPSRIKDALNSLEREGVIVGVIEGTAKRFRLNTRYVAAAELKSLLTKLGSTDVRLQERLGVIRRRPRRAGKEI